jgi:uncharacterized Zn finger protein
MTTSTLDQALEAALEGYTAEQKRKALALIATGTIRKMASGNAWTMPSSRYDITYIVVDDGDLGVWCNCPRGSKHQKCYHGAAGIMLRVNAEHAATQEPPVYDDDPPFADGRTTGELQMHRTAADIANEFNRTLGVADPFAGIPNASDTDNQPF